MPKPRPRAAQRLGLGPAPASSPLRAGYQRHGGTSHQRDFVTPQYAVVYLVAGHGRFTARDGSEHPLQPGSLFQRLPDEPHSVVAVDAAWYFLGVPAPALELLRLTGLPTLGDPVIEPGLDHRLIQRCERLIDELADAPPTRLAATSCALQQLIVDFHLRAIERRDHGRDHDFALRACAALDAESAARRPLAQIARELGMGYAAFRKRFVRQLGIAPGAWRVRRRIERAQDLLADPALPIETIARRLGYADVFAFSTQFKRYAGRSPSAFRRELG